MDALDKKLLDALQRDASRTNAELANEVGLSPSSCLRRIRKLKAKGYIARTVSLLDAAKVGRPVRAVLTVTLHDHGVRGLGQFLEDARKEPSVQQAFSVTGDVDAMLILRLTDMEEFDRVSDRLLRDNRRVRKFQTMIAVKVAKDETSFAL